MSHLQIKAELAFVESFSATYVVEYSEYRATYPFVCLRRYFLMPAAPNATIWDGGSIKLALPFMRMVVSNFIPPICTGSDNKALLLTSSEISCDSLSIVFNPSSELFDMLRAVKPVMLCKLLGILDNKQSHKTNSVK